MFHCLQPSSTSSTSTQVAVKANTFHQLFTDTVKDYVVHHPTLQQQVCVKISTYLHLEGRVCGIHTPFPTLKVGPSDSVHSWRVREVGDGNINFV